MFGACQYADRDGDVDADGCPDLSVADLPARVHAESVSAHYEAGARVCSLGTRQAAEHVRMSVPARAILAHF